MSPGSEQRCGAMFGESPEVDHSATRELSNCWSLKCVEQCQVGREWSCLGGYELPAPDVVVVRIIQASSPSIRMRSPPTGRSSQSTSPVCSKTETGATPLS